jgi:hypothetical protein
LENDCSCAMLITCKCTPFCEKLDCDTKSEPPYHATTLMPFFWSLLTTFMGRTIICWGFFSLESFHLSRYGVSTCVQHNPFGRIRYINCNDLGQFKMLFLKCSDGCKPSFCNNEKLKMKQKIPY